jgi:pimeloyl-ACP methyl ester carboxylesterase
VGEISRTARFTESWVDRLFWAVQCGVVAFSSLLTDFRGDLPKIDVPTLVVHGAEDRILPISATAQRLPGLIDDLNQPLLEFLAD